MRPRTIVLAVGATLTTFMLAGAATIIMLGAGESPGIGMIGVFIGVIAGLTAGVVVAGYASRLSNLTLAMVAAYAIFGIAFLTIAGMRYVNVPGADDTFTFPLQLGLSLAAALLALLLATRGRLGNQPKTA